MKKASESLFVKFSGAKDRYLELLGDDCEEVDQWIDKVFFFSFCIL